ncbi:MAG: hypothetical protein M1821_003725 [Bathelium mastoideum]|nr:MAG: hypothetical protein M1821_003725 [Bathelium mastoideum]
MPSKDASAGTRDSELTNHGVLQATRLGQFFKQSSLRITHLFSSPLKRTVKTAKSIQDAQKQLVAQKVDNTLESPNVAGSHALGIEIVPCRALIEQDFGFYEGKSFYNRPRDSNLTGKQAHQKEYENEPGFVPPESKESMARRADSFLDEHLLPLLQEERSSTEYIVAVVSHGMLLSSLWRCLLRRLPAKSVTIAPEVLASKSFVDLEHLGGWSNTGFLELSIAQKSSALVHEAAEDLAQVSPELSNAGCEAASEVEPSEQVAPNTVGNTLVNDEVHTRTDTKTELGTVAVPRASEPTASLEQRSNMLSEWAITIMTVNGKTHLKGIKRTGGGVGSAKFQEDQKTIETFFKRRKVG